MNAHALPTVGSLVRIGRNKTVWTVVRVTPQEEHTMVRPAGISLARPTGQHRQLRLDLADTLVAV